MFDIGFLEIMVIMIIALLVIGPERMPEVARKLGRFMGKMRRFVNSVKEDGQMQETLKDFKESMNVEEQQQQLNNINKELQSGLSFDTDFKTEELQRPNFGNSNSSTESQSGQFNKAPSQPTQPVAETVESNTAEVHHTPSKDVVTETAQKQPVTATTTTPSDSTKS